MSAATLSAWGIQRPDETVTAAASAGLALSVACALLEQESAGGWNVWGSDAVSTGGAYVKGAPVTREAYLAYRSLVKLGRAGRQGVGPCQLTAAVYQDRADALGGCWDPVVNMRVGFLALADLIHAYGLADGIRRYNGSGPAALAYRDRMLARIGKWTDRLGATTTEDDMPLTQQDAELVADTILRRPLPDLYADLKPGEPRRSLSVGDSIAWSAANAGRALTVVQRLQVALAAAPTSQSPSDLTTAVREALDALGPLVIVPAHEAGR